MRNWMFAALVAALVVVAGCKSTETQQPAPVEEGAGATAPSGPVTSGVTTPGVTGATTPGAGGLDPALRDPRNILSKRLVYFDFDSFVVKDEYRPIVEAHAKYLQSHRQTRLTLQGHADERGSREYNLALGQRRAEAVAKSMALLGAGDNQMEAVSFGKERPAVQGSDEAAWAKNRRAEITPR